MKRYSWLFLGFLPLLAACPKRQTAPDYDGIRQNSNKAQQSLDNTTTP